MGSNENMQSLASNQEAEVKLQEFESPFKVINNPKSKKLSLLIVKPNPPNKIADGSIAYPSVSFKEERADDTFAFHIMHNLNHKTILNLKTLCQNKLKSDPLSKAGFVEPYDGKLWSLFMPDGDIADQEKHIPSVKFQNMLRQIVIGLDFLRKSDFYHGNLSWESTLYYGYTVKLAGFMEKDSMKMKEAQWNDWMCFADMLQIFLDEVSAAGNGYHCGNLHSLINMLKSLPPSSLPTVKEIILEHPFFWDIAKKVTFFANTVSLKLSDDGFMEKVRMSAICEKPWDTKGTIYFQGLVEKMNHYREGERKADGRNKKRKAYDGRSSEDYVRCVCGAYTHRNQIKLDVDGIIRGNHPMICLEMKNIVDSFNMPSTPVRSLANNDAQESRTIGVPDERIGAIIGRGRRKLTEIIQTTGARIEISSRGNFMAGTSDRKVTITGTPGAIQAAKSMIMFIMQRESRTIGVPDECIAAVIGRGGRKITEISQDSGARIKISDRGDFMPGTSDRKVTITGTPEAIQAAEYMIMHRVSACSGR